MFKALAEKLKPHYVIIGEKTRTGWQFDDGFNAITDRQAEIFTPLYDVSLTRNETELLLTQEEETMPPEPHHPMNPNAPSQTSIALNESLSPAEPLELTQDADKSVKQRLVVLEEQLKSSHAHIVELFEKINELEKQIG